jgi:hypothetical protein
VGFAAIPAAHAALDYEFGVSYTVHSEDRLQLAARSSSTPRDVVLMHFFNSHLLDKPTRAYKKGAQVRVSSFSKLLTGRLATA